ncbi:MAG: SufS family cysteine desulfurase, partial [Gammaproteobacteria bacterium]|nr:SufS family cysteine desulfurase [Gammaproteobacteria bacterium]MYK29130.1 SufS family cysteine desulfurase [Gammaproteobacteria bacterium]
MAPSLDISGDFPILARQVNGHPLTYLDSAATTQKPRVVIDAIRHYYERCNANVHRAAHALAEEATAAMEDARAKVAALIGAGDAQELIFTRGTTEGINLVAACLTGRFGPGDEVLITEMEHHSNIVPWQLLCQRTGAALTACRVTPTGEIDLEDFHAKLGARTKLLAIGHVSNALGTVNPVAEMIDAAHRQGALVLIDGAQAVQHLDVDVGRLGCDFYAFSAHKLFGPTGIGALYGKAALLEELPPYQGGGEMIEHVSIEHTTYNQLPYKFEAGTPNIAGAIGFGAAVDYLGGLPLHALREREASLVNQAISHLKQIPGVQMVGEFRERVSVVSFLVDGGHPHDFGTLLDQQGIA